MIEVRLVSEQEIQQCARLANLVFRQKGQKSMDTSFPHLYTKGFGQSLGVFEDGRLVSFLGIVPSIIRIESAILHVLSVGSVCTDPDSRGKGYASQLFALAKEYAKSCRASLMLVSGNRSLYTRSDCFRFGSLRRYRLDARSATDIYDPAGHTLRAFKTTDWFDVWRIAQARPARYEQSLGDLSELIKAEGAGRRNRLQFKVLVAEAPGGSVESFAVVAVPRVGEESGGDSSDCAFVVEWGGTAALAAALFKSALRTYGLSALEIPVSWHEKEYHDLLKGSLFIQSTNFGTVHIVHASRLFAQLQPYWGVKTIQSLRCETLSAEEYAVYRAGEPAVLLKQHELVSLLFDPDAAEVVSDSEKHALSSELLTPFPYTGGLNYV